MDSNHDGMDPIIYIIIHKAIIDTIIKKKDIPKLDNI
jgi:hypothetical protein